MEELGNNKTIICSVLFLDIVEYSKKSVAGQISLKERFNAFLSTAIRNVPISDRIILDTGDGAAISFLGDIGDALHASHSMRNSLLNEGVRMEPLLLVRMGINLGPVRLVKDINGQPNIVGDGINVAQRVMGFANPGQVLVSRSYYEAVSRLSQEYVGMFHYEGSRTDKHVREHEVYVTGSPDEMILLEKNLSTRSSNTPQVIATQKLKECWVKLTETTGRWERRSIDAFRKATQTQRVAAIGIATVLLVSIIALEVKLVHRHAASKEAPSIAEASEVIAAVPVEQVKQEVAPSVPAKKEVSPAPKATKHLAAKEHVAKNVKKEARTHKPTKAGSATLALAIKPWGEIYLDGRMQGVSPPLNELQVTEGNHSIEIRNSTFQAYKQMVVAKSGTVIKIQHNFH